MRAPPVAVVGGGIAGLAAALRLAERLGPERVVLVERERRLGGKILTERQDGFVIEGGPDCFLAARRGGIELCAALDVTSELVGTNPAHRRSFVKRGGRLHELPEGVTGLVPSRLAPLLRTRLLSPLGRLRAGCEFLVPPRGGDGDESIAAFATRRFGAEAYDWIVEPLLSGIYAGDGARLSLNATFPQLALLERQHGGLLRAMLRTRRRMATAGAPAAAVPAMPAASPSPGPAFLAPRRGLGTIVEALEARLAGVHRLHAEARTVRREGAQWRVELAGAATLRAGQLVLAIPAFEAADLLDAEDPDLALLLRQIPFVSVATVSAAYPPGAVGVALDGYGYVAPRAEGGSIVACSWTSSKFPGRAPSGGTLVRVFLGRAGDEDVTRADDGTIRSLVRAELAEVLGVTAEPRLWRIHRWPRAMPQYTLGHGGRLARIEQRLAALPGLHLAGASYRGIGIPDCIQSGWNAAERAATGCAAEAA